VYILFILAYPIPLKKGKLLIIIKKTMKEKKKGEKGVARRRKNENLIHEWWWSSLAIHLYPQGCASWKIPAAAAAGESSHNLSSPMQGWVIPCDLSHEVGMVPLWSSREMGDLVTHPLPWWSGSRGDHTTTTMVARLRVPHDST
jgi:hypothetical protein